MRYISVPLLVLCLAIAVSAQETGSISGLVMINDRPIADAKVSATVKGGKTVTVEIDPDGRYDFKGLRPGTYQISAASGGYTTTRSIEIGKGQQLTIDLDLVLDRRRIYPGTINELVTISADTAQDIESVSKSVSVIPAQELRDRADFSLADTLRSIPGFRVQQLGGFGRTASIKSRGLRNQDTAILIDGMRFRDAASITGDATPFLSDFTLTSVSRIEVLRGPGSSLYGTNAIGGTVDFQTPTPRSGWHGQVSGAAGGLGLGRFRGNLSNGTNDGKFGINAGVSRTVFIKGLDGNDDARNTNFQSRIEFNPYERTNLSARFFFSDAFADLNSSPDTAGTLPASADSVIDARPGVNFLFDADDPDSSQRSRFFSGQLVVNHSLTDTFGLQASYQGLTTRRRNSNGPLGIRSQPFSGAEEIDVFRGGIHTIGGQAAWTPAAGSRTTFGYEFETERFENEHLTVNPGDNFSVRTRQSGHTVFVQQTLAFLDNRLNVSGAFRVQTFSLSHPNFMPADNPTYQGLTFTDPPEAFTGDASFSYYFRSTRTKVRSHVGNGYRVPSLYERFGSFYSEDFGFSTSGNPLLKPERSSAFDAGIDQAFHSDRVRVSATYFYTDIRDSIDFGFCVPQCLPSPDPLGRFSGYYNSNGRVARGVETSGELRPTASTGIFASYTFTNSDERNPLNLAVPASPGVPAHNFTAVVTQRFGQRFWINADLLGSSSYLFPFFNFDFATFESRYFMYRFKGSRRIDVTAGYTFPIGGSSVSLRLYGTIENVTGYKYFENGFRTAGRTGRIGLNLSF